MVRDHTRLGPSYSRSYLPDWLTDHHNNIETNAKNKRKLITPPHLILFFQNASIFAHCIWSKAYKWFHIRFNLQCKTVQCRDQGPGQPHGRPHGQAPGLYLCPPACASNQRSWVSTSRTARLWSDTVWLGFLAASPNPAVLLFSSPTHTSSTKCWRRTCNFCSNITSPLFLARTRSDRPIGLRIGNKFDWWESQSSLSANTSSPRLYSV